MSLGQTCVGHPTDTIDCSGKLNMSVWTGISNLFGPLVALAGRKESQRWKKACKRVPSCAGCIIVQRKGVAMFMVVFLDELVKVEGNRVKRQVSEQC